MYEQLYNLMKQNEIEGDFSYVTVDDEMLKNAETKLNVKIPPSYQWFLKTFGHGGIGFEVLGVGKNGEVAFVDETLFLRAYGLPTKLIAIENCDEWYYCITEDDTIVMWIPGSERVETAYESFELYLMDRTNDVLENME